MTSPSDRIGAPEKLSVKHDLSQFQCGEPTLDDWLRRRALQNEEIGASRTYVVSLEKRVVGYYALAAGAIAHLDAPGRIRRNMPDPVPVMVIGRLAVDQTVQGHGIGQSLLRDAIRRTLQAADIAGIRALLVHAISHSAKQFYERLGFISSPMDPMTLLITLAEAKKAIAGVKSEELVFSWFCGLASL
jgi:GNAT superfamily N-acetyltransferase